MEKQFYTWRLWIYKCISKDYHDFLIKVVFEEDEHYLVVYTMDYEKFIINNEYTFEQIISFI